MIKITLPTKDGSKKTYSALPITLGIQKALARYGREAVLAAQTAQTMQTQKLDMESESGVAKFNETMDALDSLTEAQAELILRAFGNQFGPDDLDNAEVGELTRVIGELQGAAYGIVRKNG